MTEISDITTIVIGRSVVSGVATSGRRAAGVVTAIVPGVCIKVDNGWQPSVLWRDFRLEGEGTAEGAPTLRRTDSGSDYGWWGRIDCDFWEAQGMSPMFWGLPNMYDLHREVPPAEVVVESLLEWRGKEDLTAAERQALARQLAAERRRMASFLEPAPVTPPPPSRPRECPGAPARPPRAEWSDVARQLTFGPTVECPSIIWKSAVGVAVAYLAFVVVVLG